jgi:hypothetical protein
MAYNNQRNVWFDRTITVWWINHVFWPHHCRTHGVAVVCILLLDNCSAHKIDRKDIHACETKLFIIFFPPNMTSNHQPVDMGQILSLKVGYCAIMLRNLLAIFDVEGGLEKAAVLHMRQRRGCRGLLHGGKATILDPMKVLEEIWQANAKYAKEEGLMRCWRKANILPPSWDADIHNEVGRQSVPEKDKTISTEACNELCGLMQELIMKAKECDTSKAVALKGSVMDDLDESSVSEIRAMVTNWIDIEDDEDIIAAEIEEALEALELSERDDTANASGVQPAGEEDEEATDDEQDVLPSFIEIESNYLSTRRFAESLGLPPDNLQILDRFQYRLRRQRLQRLTSSSPTLHHFFQPANK